jgi:hypothetical protein
MKIETRFERVYHKRQDGLYQEYIRHFIVTTNPSTGEIKTQFDKEMMGKLYKRATINDIGVNGYAYFIDADTNETIQLIALQ